MMLALLAAAVLVCQGGENVIARDLTASALRIENCQNVLVERAHVVGPGTNGVEIIGSANVTVRDSTISGVSIGLYVFHSTDVRIENNRLYQNGTNTDYEADMIFAGGDNRRITIRGNECQSTDVSFGIAIFDTYDFLIAENRVTGPRGNGHNSGYGILVYSLDSQNFNSRLGFIVSNRVHSTGGPSIYLAGANDTIVAHNITGFYGRIPWLPDLPIVVNGGTNVQVFQNLVPGYW